MVRISRKFARRTLRATLLIALALCLISLASQLYYGPGATQNASPGEGFIAWFLLVKMDIDYEQSVPAWFSSSMLLLCSMLLASIAYSTRQLGGRYTLHWGILSLIFILLSLDESIVLHEHTSELSFVPNLISGVHYTRDWVFVYAPLVVIFVFAYTRFLFNLPIQIRLLFIAAGALYVSGAFTMEIVGMYVVHHHGGLRTAVYDVQATLEEFLEMSGISLFLYALLLKCHLIGQETEHRAGC
jgi:hypothetical protein